LEAFQFGARRQRISAGKELRGIEEVGGPVVGGRAAGVLPRPRLDGGGRRRARRSGGGARKKGPSTQSLDATRGNLLDRGRMTEGRGYNMIFFFKKQD
jgi:hypothetical protein